jgi:hypothetical protein
MIKNAQMRRSSAIAHKRSLNMYIDSYLILKTITGHPSSSKQQQQAAAPAAPELLAI